MLKAWGGGDTSALDRAAPIVYAELHRFDLNALRTAQRFPR